MGFVLSEKKNVSCLEETKNVSKNKLYRLSRGGIIGITIKVEFIVAKYWSSRIHKI